MEEEYEQKLPTETRDALIRSMNSYRNKIYQKVVEVSEIQIEADRSLMNRVVREPVRMRSAQLSSLSCGSLVPKI